MLTGTLHGQNYHGQFPPELWVLTALAVLSMPDSVPAADDLMMPDAVGLTVVVAAAARVVTVLQHLHKRRHGPPKPATAELPMPAAAAPFPSCCWDTDGLVAVVIFKDNDAASAVAPSLTRADLLQGKCMMAGWW